MLWREGEAIPGVTSDLKKYMLHSKVDLWMIRGSLIT